MGFILTKVGVEDDEQTRDDESTCRAGCEGYLNFYNTCRPHSSLDGKTPDQVCFNQPMPEAVAA